MKHCTSIEQSKKLLELGLSPESADMCYLPTHIGDEHHWIASLSSYSECTKMTDVSIDYCIPCWSLGALLELMPLPRLEKDVFPILEQKNFEEEFGWECITYGDNAMSLCEQWSSTKIDVCYKMVIWLLENGYIKTK